MSRIPEKARRFFDRFLRGEVSAEDIDDFIDAWHDNPEKSEIFEFLGMTREEYALWLRDPEALPQIAQARRPVRMQNETGT
jgi:hypothetical protein